VAREVAAGLVNSEDVEYLAATALTYHSGSVSFTTYPLGAYLAKVLNCDSAPEATLKARGFASTMVGAAGVDVVLSFECFEEIWSWPLAMLGIKAAGVVHDLVPFRIEESPGTDNKSSYFKSIANMIAKADLLIHVSESTRNDVLKLFPEAEQKSTVIYNAHGSERIGRTVAHPRSAGSQPTIAMVGTVEIRKNHHAVVRAIPELAERLGVRPRLLVIGDNVATGDLFGGHFRYILSKAQRHADVIFTGYVDDTKLVGLYQQADAVIFPSLWEGFGMPILEALSFGVPVVASDTASHPEVGRSYIDYCDPYDTSDIANALASVLQRSASIRRWRRLQGQAWARRFTWKEAAAGYVAVLGELSQGLPIRPVAFAPTPRESVRLPASDTAVVVPIELLGGEPTQLGATARVMLALTEQRLAAGPVSVLIRFSGATTGADLARAVDNFGEWLAEHPHALVEVVTAPGLDLPLEDLLEVRFLKSVASGEFASGSLSLGGLGRLIGDAAPLSYTELIAPSETELAFGDRVVQWERAVVIAPTSPSGAAVRSLPRREVRELLGHERLGSELLAEYVRGIARSGGLIPYLNVLEDKQAQEEDWLAEEHAYLEAGLDLVVLTRGVEQLRQAREAQARVAEAKAWRTAFVLYEPRLFDAPADVLVVRRADSLAALALSAPRVLSLRTGAEQIADFELAAAALGRAVAVVGVADELATEAADLYCARSAEAALAWLTADTVEAAVATYPANWSEAARALDRFAAEGQLPNAGAWALLKALRRPGLDAWGQLVASIAYEADLWDRFKRHLSRSRSRNLVIAPDKFELIGGAAGAVEFKGTYGTERPIGGAEFLWTGPSTVSVIRAPFSIMKTGTLQLVIQDMGRNSEDDLRLLVNGWHAPLESGRTASGMVSLTTRVDPSALEPGPLELEVHVSLTFAPGGGDERTLGVALQSVSYTADAPAPAEAEDEALLEVS